MNMSSLAVVTIENPVDASAELLKDEPFDLVVTDVNKRLYGFGLHQMITGTNYLPVLALQEKKGKRAVTTALPEKKGKRAVNTALPEKKGKRAVTGKSAIEQGKQGKDNSVDRAVPPKTKLTWTEPLHKKFLAAIKDIGYDEAKPAKILAHMKDPALSRRNVSSHLQKYRIYLRQVTDASSRIQAPDMNLASRVNQLNTAYGAFGECGQFHPENFRVQSSIPSSSIHASTSYLTDNVQHLKGVNAMEESPDIGDLSTTLMNQGNAQPPQKYRIYLRQVTDASSRIQAPDMNLASRVNQLNTAYGAFDKCSQFHQENVRVQSSIPSSSIHASTSYLTDNLQHLKGVNAMEESPDIGDLSTTLMNQGNVQSHQQNDEDEMSDSEFPWWWL